MIYGNTLASIYDLLNSEIDYVAFAGFAREVFSRFCDFPVGRVCELACGTGSVATLLAKDGFSVTALDLSPEMLTEAEQKTRAAGVQVNYVNADMRSFSLYTKSDACTCFLDSMNYLLTPADFCRTLQRVRENLRQGGIFLFDVNSRYKFENIYSDNAYVLEEDGVLCAWQNFYNEKTKICDFYLSIFSENPDGSYTRTEEHQRERMYTERMIRGYLEKCGFTLLGIYSDFNFKKGDEDHHERLYFVAKAN